VNDIYTAAADGLKVLYVKPPIREATLTDLVGADVSRILLIWPVIAPSRLLGG